MGSFNFSSIYLETKLLQNLYLNAMALYFATLSL